MIEINLPTSVEKHFWQIVLDDYSGDVLAAMEVLLRLYDQHGWKERLHDDVESIRSEVRRKGGVSSNDINSAIEKYRKGQHSTGG